MASNCERSDIVLSSDLEPARKRRKYSTHSTSSQTSSSSRSRRCHRKRSTRSSALFSDPRMSKSCTTASKNVNNAPYLNFIVSDADPPLLDLDRLSSPMTELSINPSDSAFLQDETANQFFASFPSPMCAPGPDDSNLPQHQEDSFSRFPLSESASEANVEANDTTVEAPESTPQCETFLLPQTGFLPPKAFRYNLETTVPRLIQLVNNAPAASSAAMASSSSASTSRRSSTENQTPAAATIPSVQSPPKEPAAEAFVEVEDAKSAAKKAFSEELRRTAALEQQV